MADNTTNYNLTKPLETEKYDIKVQNGNMDKIDTAIGKLQDEVTTHLNDYATLEQDYTQHKLDYVEESTNLYNHATSLPNFSINKYANGDAVPNSGYFASDFIEVVPLTEYFIKYASAVSYFDAQKTYINGTNTAGGLNIVVTTPANAKYLRFSWSLSSFNGLQQLNKGNIELPYEDYYNHINVKFIEDELVSYEAGGKNLFDKSKILDNYTFDQVTGDLIQGLITGVSEFIDISFADQLTFTKVARIYWYDANKEFIEQNTLTTYTRPFNAKYIRVVVLKTNYDTAQIEIGGTATAYEAYKKVISKNILPKIENQNVSTLSEDYEIRKAIAEKNAQEYIPNVKEKLIIPTYVPTEIEGYQMATHPNVLYFENGWNGYKFWMVMTPYPYANNQYENPSIVASNDNITWVEPAPNPIAPLESTDTFQSDPEIVMNGNTMEMWYRATQQDGSNLFTTMYRKTSTDGINWTTREVMFDDISFEGARSPAIILENGIYKMWYGQNVVNDYYIKYAESADGKNWVSRLLDIKLDYDDYYFWHGDVYKHDNGKIDMIVACKSENNEWAMFYTYSYDNINYVPPMLLIKATTGTTRWDNYNLYKPSLVMVKGEYYLYYATSRWIGLTKGKTLYELNKPMLGTSFPIKMEKYDRDTFLPTDLPNAYPEETISYTSAWSSVDQGWPELSGSIKTEKPFTADGHCKQYFYADKKSYFYFRSGITNAWTAWKKIEGATF